MQKKYFSGVFHGDPFGEVDVKGRIHSEKWSFRRLVIRGNGRERIAPTYKTLKTDNRFFSRLFVCILLLVFHRFECNDNNIIL